MNNFAVLDQSVAKVLREYLHNFVSPQAERLDQDSSALAIALDGLGDRRLLGLKVPGEYGGSGLSATEYYQTIVDIAQASGILAFLQTQHQSAAAQIARFGNESQKKVLPSMVSGEVKIGVGFSHLRRQGQPLLKAEPTEDGFQLTGTIPWITGYGFFQKAIAGATLPNGDELYGFIPLENTTQPDGGNLNCGDPLPLAAMGASRTVAVKLQQWHLKSENVLIIKPAGSIKKGDRQKVLHHGFFALGCAHGSLNFLRTSPIAADKLDALEHRLMTLQDKMFHAITDDNPDFEHQLSLRIQVVAIAQEFTNIALISSSGAGNVLSHPAQRLYREALMFTVFGQTQTIRNATLQSLLS